MQKIYGAHAVSHFLEKHASLSMRLVVRYNRKINKYSAELAAIAEKKGVPVVYYSKEDFAQLLGEGVSASQGVLLEAREVPVEQTQNLQAVLAKKPKRLLVLDQIQDPHNLGACIRSANVLGAEAVIVTRHASAPITPIVRKVACGGVEGTPLVVINNLAEGLKTMRKAGLWIVGLAAEAEIPLAQADLRDPLALVIGSESQGLRRLTKVHCDYLVSIPLLGSVSSLNASVAAGIALYEAARQQNSIKAAE